MGNARNYRLQDITDKQTGRVCMVKVGPEDNESGIGRVSATGRGKNMKWRAEYLLGFMWEPVTSEEPTIEAATAKLLAHARDSLTETLEAVEAACAEL